MAHPTTLKFHLNGALLLATQGRIDAAARQLQAMEPQLLAWLGAELYSSEAVTVRRQLVASQSSFQHAAINLALQPGAGQVAADLAASAVLRLKGLQAEEEAYLARIVRRGDSVRARELATEIAGLHSQLARTFHVQTGDEAVTGREKVAELTTQLEARELALGRVSRAYAQHLQVRNANLGDLRSSLPSRAGLLDIREYRPVDFRTGNWGQPRWAGILLVGFDQPQVLDLGPVEASESAVEVLLREPDSAAGAQAARDLHKQLIEPLAEQLAGLERLYIAPDGVAVPGPLCGPACP
jgi:hypothetical protein